MFQAFDPWSRYFLGNSPLLRNLNFQGCGTISCILNFNVSGFRSMIKIFFGKFTIVEEWKNYAIMYFQIVYTHFLFSFQTGSADFPCLHCVKEQRVVWDLAEDWPDGWLWIWISQHPVARDNVPSVNSGRMSHFLQVIFKFVPVFGRIVTLMLWNICTM